MIGISEIPRFRISRLRAQLDALIRGRLWLQVMIGLLLGILVGLVLGPELKLVDRDTAALAGSWLALPGKLFLALISMVVYVLVMGSIIRGIGSAPSGQLGRTGIGLALLVIVTTTFAAVIGLALAQWLAPGSLIEGFEVGSETGQAVGVALGVEAPDLIAGIIPTNPFASLAGGEMLGLVVFALLFGIAAAQSDPEKVAPFMALIDAVLEVTMTVIKWAMFLAPLAVFGLMAQLVSQVGIGTLAGLLGYVMTVLLGLVLLQILYLLMVALLGGYPPMKFLKQIGANLLLAFSTSSSAAVMPMSIATARDKLGVKPHIATLVMPLGATVNMAGTALYQAVAVAFLAQISGIELSVGYLGLIVLTLVASSIGSPGTPGVSVAILGKIALSFGIPTGGIALIMGVDRILDMSRTTVNVTGDLAAAVVLSRHSGKRKEGAKENPSPPGAGGDSET